VGCLDDSFGCLTRLQAGRASKTLVWDSASRFFGRHLIRAQMRAGRRKDGSKSNFYVVTGRGKLSVKGVGHGSPTNPTKPVGGRWTRLDDIAMSSTNSAKRIWYDSSYRPRTGSWWHGQRLELVCSCDRAQPMRAAHDACCCCALCVVRCLLLDR
jgi:hypothetical protein